MFGLTFEKLLLIGVIAVFVLGPERLPGYAAKLAQLVRTLRDMANGAKDRMRDEMGPEFDDVDWKKLDPRQYDPRRIIREALLDDGSDAGGATAGSAAVRPVSRARPESTRGEEQYKPRSAGGPGVAGAAGVAAAAGVSASARVSASAGVAESAGMPATAGSGVPGVEVEPVPSAGALYDSEAT